jgi:hypothetical protein
VKTVKQKPRAGASPPSQPRDLSAAVVRNYLSATPADINENFNQLIVRKVGLPPLFSSRYCTAINWFIFEAAVLPISQTNLTHSREVDRLAKN